MGPELQALIEEHKPYLQVEEDGRIKCELNGHVLPAAKQTVENFVNGPKFQRLKKRAEEEAGFSKYEPFIIKSKNYPDKLYCAMTCLLVNKNMDSVRRHMKGKAFLKAKEKFEKDEHNLMEEPDLEDSEPSGAGEAEEKPEELVEGIESMDIGFEPRGDAVAPEAAGEAAAAPETADRSQKPPKKKTRKLGDKKGNATESVLQPETPPQGHSKGPGSADAEMGEGKRKHKRLRTNGSRPKKPKRAEP